MASPQETVSENGPPAQGAAPYAVNTPEQPAFLPTLRSTPRGQRYDFRGRPYYLPDFPFGDPFRNHLVSVIGEFCGTFMFLFYSFGIVQIANSDPNLSKTGSNPGQIILIALGFGFSLFVTVWCFFRVSGGLFNPCVALGLTLVGAITPVRGILLMCTELIAGMAAGGVIKAITPGPVLFADALGGGMNRVQGMWLEAFLTAQLVFSVLALAVEKHRGTFLAPFGIGMTLFIDHLFGVYYTGTGVNPARSLGAAVALRYFPGYHWIYWVGPIIGTGMAVCLYGLLKYLRFETANPGQDADHPPDRKTPMYGVQKNATSPV